MYTEAECAIELYRKASEASQQGKTYLAEVYYLQSKSLFVKAGGRYYLNAANALNALAILRKSRGDREGALRAVRETSKIMEKHGMEFTSPDAELIRFTAWDLIDDLMAFSRPKTTSQPGHHPSEKILI